ncbi:hypothetical protein AB852_31870 [Streptomyces uncialis]|uniref:Uncharacterized protein n=1 Tax=Streptomyces uncialis TaxID=1048205 RepID=A0A1Q4UZP9_9ACTN|nr:hypothetical protein AB852_31870 [Streptomyces uncialis]
MRTEQEAWFVVVLGRAGACPLHPDGATRRVPSGPYLDMRVLLVQEVRRTRDAAWVCGQFAARYFLLQPGVIAVEVFRVAPDVLGDDQRLKATGVPSTESAGALHPSPSRRSQRSQRKGHFGGSAPRGRYTTPVSGSCAPPYSVHHPVGLFSYGVLANGSGSGRVFTMAARVRPHDAGR